MMELSKKIAFAIDYLQIAAKKAKSELGRDLILAFGCDRESQVLLSLCKIAGIKYRAVYQSTGMDNPEVLAWLRSTYPHVSILPPPVSMSDLIRDHMALPSRLNRFCSSYYQSALSLGNGIIVGAREVNFRLCVYLHTISLYGFGATRRLDDGSLQSSDVLQATLFDAGGPISDLSTSKDVCIIIRPMWSWTCKQIDAFLDMYHIQPCKFPDQNICGAKCVLCPLMQAETRIKHAFRYHHLIDKLYLPEIKSLMDQGIFEGYNSPEDVLQAWIMGKLSD